MVQGDIKPSNIFVATQDPFWVKLAYFTLAKDATNLITQCGSFLYSAPKVLFQAAYTPLVDISSLGVVVLEYAYGLPELAVQVSAKNPPTYTGLLSCCNQILDAVNDASPFPLKTFLSGDMLSKIPQERLSASECLSEAHRLGFPRI